MVSSPMDRPLFRLFYSGTSLTLLGLLYICPAVLSLDCLTGTFFDKNNKTLPLDQTTSGSAGQVCGWQFQYVDVDATVGCLEPVATAGPFSVAKAGTCESNDTVMTCTCKGTDCTNTNITELMDLVVSSTNILYNRLDKHVRCSTRVLRNYIPDLPAFTGEQEKDMEAYRGKVAGIVLTANNELFSPTTTTVTSTTTSTTTSPPPSSTTTTTTTATTTTATENPIDATTKKKKKGNKTGTGIPFWILFPIILPPLLVGFIVAKLGYKFFPLLYLKLTWAMKQSPLTDNKLSSDDNHMLVHGEPALPKHSGVPGEGCGLCEVESTQAVLKKLEKRNNMRMMIKQHKVNDYYKQEDFLKSCEYTRPNTHSAARKLLPRIDPADSNVSKVDETRTGQDSTQKKTDSTAPATSAVEKRAGAGGDLSEEDEYLDWSVDDLKRFDENFLDMARHTAGIDKTGMNLPSGPDERGGRKKGETQTFNATTVAEAHFDDKVKTKRAAIEIGISLETKLEKYIITKLIGAGAFGDVYQVECHGDSRLLAVKAEIKQSGKFNPKLRLPLEAYIMRFLCKRNKDPFPFLHDTGSYKNYNFIVMHLTGLSFDKLLSFDGDFSDETAFSFSWRMMEAVSQLHKAKFIHRDLKPGNFALSDSNAWDLMLIDYGLAKKFWSPAGASRPRMKRPNVGTPRYQPIRAMDCEDQTPNDDIESVLYVMAELYSGNALPWKGRRSYNEVQPLKAAFVKGEITEDVHPSIRACAILLGKAQKYRPDTGEVLLPLLRLHHNETARGKMTDDDFQFDWHKRWKAEEKAKLEDSSKKRKRLQEKGDEEAQKKPAESAAAEKK